MTAFSIVIPAHNEEAVIGRCLAGFLPELAEADVVVVPNGCTDRTAAVAASFGVTVVDVSAAGKATALNAGDAATAVLPRIYLDADIVVDAATLRALASALAVDRPLVAAPRVHFVLDDRPWAVRAFYAAYTQLPYVNEGLTGLGIFGLSAAGRARFAEFPQVTADDLFVQRLFSPSERVVLTDAQFDVQTPRTLRALIAVRTRTAFGSAELARTEPAGTDAAPSTRATVQALGRLVVKQPALLPSAAVYIGVTLAARVRARRRAAQSWQRDTTTR